MSIGPTTGTFYRSADGFRSLLRDRHRTHQTWPSQQNGRHERVHLTLKKEATKPAARNFLQQQARFDKFIEVFNNDRPHQALDMKCRAEIYRPLPRIYQGLPELAGYVCNLASARPRYCGYCAIERSNTRTSQRNIETPTGITLVLNYLLVQLLCSRNLSEFPYYRAQV
jgi:putative transposase